jgi:hypothetical protein
VENENKVAYCPVWEGCIECYVKNKVSKELWRFKRINYEYNDLVNEAYLVFHECRSRFKNKYPTLKENQSLFMSYFKRCLHNLFYDFGVDSSKIKMNIVDKDLSEIDYSLGDDDKKSLSLILKDAPKEVKQVLSIIMNSPLELLEFMGFTKKNSRSIFNNKKLCDLIGVNSVEVNLVDMVKKYLLGTI